MVGNRPGSLNLKAVDLRVANSKLDARLQQLDFQSHSLMQDQKKVGPNLKDARLKLNKNWIPVWLRKPSDFRPTTKMPNFRLTDHQIQAISAYLWQSAFTDPLPKQNPGNAEHGKELFETRGCLACIRPRTGGRRARRSPKTSLRQRAGRRLQRHRLANRKPGRFRARRGCIPPRRCATCRKSRRSTRKSSANRRLARCSTPRSTR